MFEPFTGLPSTLLNYVVALNDHDLDRALTYVHPDATVTTTSETGIVVRARNITEFREWLTERFGSDNLAIAPITASTEGEVSTLHFAVTRISPDGVVASLLQDVDYTVVDELITAVHGYLPRARRVRGT